MQRLYRSRQKMIGGVAAGMAEYFDVDVALMRIVWVLAFFAGGIGLPAYIVCWIIMPDKPEKTEDDQKWYEKPDSEARVIDPEIVDKKAGRRRNAGVLLIGLGFIFLARNVIPWQYWDKGWPLILIAIGLYIIFREQEGDQR